MGAGHSAEPVRGSPRTREYACTRMPAYPVSSQAIPTVPSKSFSGGGAVLVGVLGWLQP